MSNLYNETFSFAQEHINPHTTEADNNAEFPLQSYQALKENGYMGLLIPKEYGGKGFGLEEHAQCIQAIAENCASTALAYMMHNVATMCIVLHASDEIKNTLLPQIAKGEATLALAYSETGTGTHFYQPEINVEKKDDSYILNGRKSFVTGAQIVDYYLVIANTYNDSTLDNWLIPSDTKGLKFEAQSWDGLGMRGNASIPMILDNVTVDDSQRIGTQGSGMEQIFAVVAPYFILGLSAVYTGVALQAHQLINAHSINRKYSNAQPLCELPTVQSDLASIYMKAQSARHFTQAAAYAGAHGHEDALTQIIAARIHASQQSIEVCTLAMKIGGGTAYAKKLPIERLLRDSFASQVMAPSTDVLSIWLGKALTNQDIL